MAITNQSIIDTASTVYRSLFQEIFQGPPPGTYANFVQLISTDSKVNEIDVLGAMPVIREWTSEKLFKDARAYSVSATVKAFERSFRINRLNASLDRTGLIADALRRFLSDTNGAIYDKLAHDALFDNLVGYDGVALFSASHPHGPAGATQSNTSSTAFSFAQHDAVMQAGMTLRDEESEPFGVSYDTLIVGPKLMKLAMEVTQSNERLMAVANDGLEAGTRVAASTIPNVYGGGQMKLIVDPRLVGSRDDYYYYLDTSKSAKPIVMFEARAPEAVMQDQMSDEGRFLHDELRFSVEADLAFAAGAWQVAFAGIL